MVTNHVKSFVSVQHTKFEISKTSILKASMIVLILGALQKEYQKYVFFGVEDVINQTNWQKAGLKSLQNHQITETLAKWHQNFILIPIDKARVNVTTACKGFYPLLLMKGLL